MTTAPEPSGGTVARRVAHHHETDQQHPLADRPCVIEAEYGTRPDGSPRYIGRCATHAWTGRGYIDASFPTEAEAIETTRCDLGRMWCFTVVHTDDHDLPDVVTLSGLWEYARDLGMAEFTGDVVPCCPDLGLYRFNPLDGTNQWLKLTLAPAPGGFLVDVKAAHPTREDTDPRDGCDARDCGHDYSLDGVTYLHEVVPLP